MATLLSGLGNGGRRKRLKHRLQSLIPPTTQGSAFCPILHGVLVLPKLSFNEFIRHQFQALIFLLPFLIKQKSKSPSAASRGKPCAAENPYNFSSISRHC